MKQGPGNLKSQVETQVIFLFFHQYLAQIIGQYWTSTSSVPVSVGVRGLGVLIMVEVWAHCGVWVCALGVMYGLIPWPATVHS